MTGNTLPRLQTNDVEDLILPNPEISKQEEIVKHINELKGKAKRLQKEGDALLEEAKQKILVADDEASIRRILETRLKMAGYSVVTAEDGEEAFDLLNELGIPFRK